MADNQGLEVLNEQASVNGAVKYVLKGYIDDSSLAELKTKLEDQIKSKLNKVLVDMKAVSFVSSSGWVTLLNISRDARKLGGNVVFYNMAPKLEKIYKLLGLSHFMNQCESEEEALKLL